MKRCVFRSSRVGPALARARAAASAVAAQTARTSLPSTATPGMR